MNKLAIILLSFLVILIPISISMNISNANAIAESEYYTDQYMRDTNDMINYYEHEYSYPNNDGYGGSEQDRPYGNNDYGSEFTSYKSDYNEDYKSKDKDKDSSSVSISKINCITTNINNNGAIVFEAPPGLAVAGAGSEETSTGSFSGNGERYYDRFKDTNPLCITINNNTIVNNNATADGNDPNIIDTCEECLTENLNEAQLRIIESNLGSRGLTLKSYCELLAGTTLTNAQKLEDLNRAFDAGPVPIDIRIIIFECLDRLGILVFDPQEFSGLSGLPSGGELLDIPTAPLT